MTAVRRSLLLGLTLLFALGCSRSEPEKPATAAAKSDELAAKYTTATPAERIQAALKICYVGKDCDGAEAQALLSSAATPAEREALQATARSAFVRQYAEFLREQGKKPDSVSSEGPENRTIKLSGEPCSRFLLENFGAASGKTARLVGFHRFECENKALRAGVDL
jgi:hypothetical protein